MLRCLSTVAVLLLSVLPTKAQSCGPRQIPVEMQVHLYFDDNNNQDQSDSGISLNVENDAAHRASGPTGEHRWESAANLDIRVQLQDGFGTTLQESPPNGEGKLVFHVCRGNVYRIFVRGSNIEDSLVESVDPARGDRLMTVALHHKQTRQAKTDAIMVSANRLKIPRQAKKELERGNAALIEGNLAEARKRYNKAIEFYPQYDSAYNNLGVALMQSGDPRNGKAAFARAVEINDHFARAYVNLAKIAFDERKFSTAESLAKKALTSEPLNPGALFMAAQSAYFAGVYGEAVAFTRALHALPHANFALAHYLCGKALQADNQAGAAAAEYELFLKENPGDPNAYRASQEIALLRKRSALSP